MMFSAYKLSKQGDNIQPCRIRFPILSQSVITCKVLTAASWSANRFLRRQVRMSGIPISWRSQFVVIHTVKGFTIVNEAELDVFPEFSCFLYDPTDVGNLISDSSSFCKPSMENCKYYYVFIIYVYNKRVQNAVLGCNIKNDRIISVHFQGKPFNIAVIQVYAPTSNAE